MIKTLNEGVPDYQIRDLIREADIDKNGTVEFNEFLKVFTCSSAHIVHDGRNYRYTRRFGES